MAAATVPPMPGRCANMTRDILPDFLPDVSRLSRDRLAGLRATIGEVLASRKNLTLVRGKACPSIKIQISDERRLSALKMFAPNFSLFVNTTVQIDDAICDVKLNVRAYSFLRVHWSQSGWLE